MKIRFNFKTTCICTCLFLFFLVLSFPFRNLRGYIFGKIYTQTRVLIVAEDIYPALLGWPGIGISNVDVTLPVGTQELNLTSKRLTFRIGPAGIIPPRSAVHLKLSGLSKGGDLYIRYAGTKEIFDIDLETNRLALEQLTLSGLGDILSGKLTMESDLSLDSTDLARTVGNSEIEVESLNIAGQNYQGIVFPPMNLGTIEGRVAIKNGAAEISRFQIGNSTTDLSGSLSGDIKLSKVWSDSKVNLALRLQLSDKLRQNPQSETLISLLESYKTSKPGQYGMRWNATVNELSTNILIATQKLNE